MLHALFLRSPYAMPKSTVSLRMPPKLCRVVGVFTGSDLNENAASCPCASEIPGLEKRLAIGCWLVNAPTLSHPVAVVVATDRYAARDALDLIEVDYDPCRLLVTPIKAIETILH